jgi:uncharacterized protein YgiM (DUF1202 family)
MKVFKTLATAAACFSLIAGAGVVTTQASTTGINPLQSPVVPTATRAPSSGTVGTCTVLRGITANVRTGPGTGYRRLGTIRGGTTFICIGRTGNWLRIRFAGRIAYVYRPLARCNIAI